MIDYASLFCGAGLFDIPFELPEFRCVLATDSDHEACLWYGRNRIAPVLTRDVGELHPQIAAKLVLCTPPCQQFSLVNPKAKGFNDKHTARLFRHAARVCREMSAELVLLENVEGLVRRGWAPAVTEVFAEYGFSGQWKVMDASDYGVPQRRKRVVFAFDRHGKEFPWPEPEPGARQCSVATTATTLAESRLLQQIPAWFRLPAGRAGRRMSGNGVPLGLANAIRDAALRFFSQAPGPPARSQ